LGASSDAQTHFAPSPRRRQPAELDWTHDPHEAETSWQRRESSPGLSLAGQARRNVPSCDQMRLL